MGKKQGRKGEGNIPAKRSKKAKKNAHGVYRTNVPSRISGKRNINTKMAECERRAGEKKNKVCEEREIPPNDVLGKRKKDSEQIHRTNFKAALKYGVSGDSPSELRRKRTN